MNVDFPGIALQRGEDALILRSERTLHTLSSAVIGGGFAQVQTMLSRYVSKYYDNDDPVTDLMAFAAEQGVTGDFIGLLTAVPMRKARHITLTDGALRVSIIITAGIGNASAAGLSVPQIVSIGTINIIVLIAGNLVPAAMVNAIKTVTEAETAVLVERGIRTFDGHMATGTSTDAIVIACTGEGVPLDYAGPVTNVGYLIGQGVRHCLMAALDAE